MQYIYNIKCGFQLIIIQNVFKICVENGLLKNKQIFDICQYYSQNLNMNIKVKLSKNSPNRYNPVTSSQEFKPIVLSKIRQSIRNDKQNTNNNNQINYDHQFHKRNHKNQLFRSYEFQKLKPDNLLECQQDFIATDRNYNRNQDQNRNSFFNQRCQSQQNLMNLRNSNQNNFAKKGNESKLDDYNKQENIGLTFNSIKMGFKNGSVINNQEFIQQKKIKKQVIDQIIKNGPKNNFCSQEFINKFNNMIECSNKDGKKAKYRIINSEQSDQLYYCSKCSILLLQQGFQVQQIELNNKKQSKKQKILKRKAECQSLMYKIKDIQSNLKQNVTELGKNSYLSVIQQEIERVAETYDIIIEIISQIKVKEIQRLNSAKQDIIRQTQKQKNQLFEKFTYAQSIRDEVQEIFKNNISFSDSEFNSIFNQYSNKVQNFQQYQPLQFSIKQQTIESRLEKIVTQIQEYFNGNKNSVNFSFDKNQTSNSKSQDFIVQQAKKPFRNLFPQEDSKAKVKKVSKYYNGQFIQENQKNYSPNFHKRYH